MHRHLLYIIPDQLRRFKQARKAINRIIWGMLYMIPDTYLGVHLKQCKKLEALPNDLVFYIAT